MKYASLLLSVVLALSGTASDAQPFDTDAKKQGLKGAPHRIKRSFYKPVKVGDKWEADLTAFSLVFGRTNQLLEYNESGRMTSEMSYAAGSNETPGSVQRYFYKDTNLIKEELVRADKQNVYTTEYFYGPSGYRIKSVTTRGPGDQLGAAVDEHTDFLCDAAGCVKKSVTKAADGSMQHEMAYTYDAQQRKTSETYLPAGIYTSRRFTYDKAGNLVTAISMDDAGKPAYIVTYAYDAAGREVKRISIQMYDGKKQSEQIVTSQFNAQGDKTAERRIDGEKTTLFAWQHSYDATGNRIKTVYMRDGAAADVELLQFSYHK